MLMPSSTRMLGTVASRSRSVRSMSRRGVDHRHRCLFAWHPVVALAVGGCQRRHHVQAAGVQQRILEAREQVVHRPAAGVQQEVRVLALRNAAAMLGVGGGMMSRSRTSTSSKYGATAPAHSGDAAAQNHGTFTQDTDPLHSRHTFLDDV